MAAETEVPRPDFEDDNGGGPVKTFLEHLEDLRWTLIKSLSALLVGMVVCLVAAPQLVAILKWPLVNSGAKIRLELFGPMGGFIISLKIALYGGITLALPFILYFLGQFVVPALKRREKEYFLRAVVVGGGLFLIGVLICYFWVLTLSLRAIPQFNSWLGIQTEIWRAEDYFQFVIMLMLGMGISFEMPLLLLTLVRLGIVPHEWLAKGRRYFFLANLIICSFITPDYVSTMFLVIPVQVLLEACVWISAYWRWQEQRQLTERPGRKMPAKPPLQSAKSG